MNKQQIRIFYSKGRKKRYYPDFWNDPNTWHKDIYKYYIIENKGIYPKLLYF